MGEGSGDMDVMILDKAAGTKANPGEARLNPGFALVGVPA